LRAVKDGTHDTRLWNCGVRVSTVVTVVTVVSPYSAHGSELNARAPDGMHGSTTHTSNRAWRSSIIARSPHKDTLVNRKGHQGPGFKPEAAFLALSVSYSPAAIPAPSSL
jgi:hypothetical protein